MVPGADTGFSIRSLGPVLDPSLECAELNLVERDGDRSRRQAWQVTIGVGG
jgi:hypothetical protein